MEDAALLTALGNVLRTLRETQGLTLDALAAQTGIPRSTISQYECGTRDIYIGDLDRIAGTLEVTAVQIMQSVRDEK